MTTNHGADPSIEVWQEQDIEPGEYELEPEQFKDLGRSALSPAMVEAAERVVDDVDNVTVTREHKIMEVSIKKLGSLRELLPGMNFKGKISIASRLADGSATAEGIAQADSLADDCYVPTTKGATVRCGDGRELEGYDEADATFSELGPQVFGATIGVAQGRRLRKGAVEGTNLKADVKDAVDNGGSDYAPGGHTDVVHAAEGGLGCGAVASLEAKGGHYVDEGANASIAGVTEAALSLDGKALPQGFGKQLHESGSELKQYETEYFADKADVIDYLEDFNKFAKQVVAGNHKEYKVRLNYVRGTTFNTGKFNTLTDNNYQIFNVDVWYLIDQFGAEDAAFILADNLATAAELTDGSLEVEARLPAAA